MVDPGTPQETLYIEVRTDNIVGTQPRSRRQQSATLKLATKYEILGRLPNSTLLRNLLDTGRCSWAVPVFHGYRHNASCQVSFSPRRIPGFGLLDGEGIIRLWSDLRRFAKVTKEMTSSHRSVLLTLGLDHYSQKKKRLELLDICTDDIARLQEEYKVPLNVLNLNEMIVEEKECFRQSSNHASGHDWRSRYTKEAALSLYDRMSIHMKSCQKTMARFPFLKIQGPRGKLMCIEEMQIFHNFLREKEKDLDQKIEQMKMAASEFDVGVRAHLLSEYFKIPKRILYIHCAMNVIYDWDKLSQ
ncbi:hypothetical protein CAPTEDRAFT_197977 [Capitella teleta]|uniref:Uncharacterized protein n=1 Tax=Capitella teleta TaxID=283909 RepID=R7UGP5_CAPTE|nr:hypothetical protein CAPTEDRAFT_197977 [Capitella teleta]|eukprot:ELU02948.1 hypothetical protein CAPTEDRAFT_197977 [Capitella teleta]